MNPFAEKYETIFPDKSEDPGPWVDPASARVGKRAVSRSNRMPPGECIDQPVSDIKSQPMSMGGETDVSADYNAESKREGFKKLPMSPTEDMYTREHNDAFYDDCGGFVERNNYLDRS